MMSKFSLAKLCPLKLTLVTCILLNNCRPIEDSYGVKDSNFAQTEDRYSAWQDNLMMKIEGDLDGKWTIYVEYDNKLGYGEQQKDKIETAIKEDLNMWLQPLRDNGYAVVAKNKINIVRRKPVSGADLTIKLDAQSGGASYSKYKVITMKRTSGIPSNSLIPGTADFSRNDLRHELGHAFGLDDTYRARYPSTGGSNYTAGKHLESLMSCYYLRHTKGLSSLTKDDENGIINYYNTVRHSSPSKANIEMCLSSELEFDSSPPAGCVPKQPLIYVTKYYEDKDYHMIINLYADISLNVNDTDTCGYSALHHAAANTKEKMVTKIIDIYSDSVDVNIQDSTGMTPLHLAVAAKGYSAEAGKIISRLLKHPNTNINIVDNDGNTAYSYAKYHNEQVDLGKVAQHTRYPKEILTKLAGANNN